MTYEFDLPVGARLVKRADAMGVDVLNANDTVIATISEPTAWDADNDPVKTDYATSGRELSIHVAHRSADVAYPITVDPVVGDGFGWYPYGDTSEDGWKPWGDTRFSRLGAYNGEFGRGLYVYENHFTYYGDADAGGGEYDAPGNSIITRLRYDWMRTTSTCGGMYVIVGIANPAFTAWEPNGGEHSLHTGNNSGYFAYEHCIDGHNPCEFTGGEPYDRAFFLASTSAVGNQDFKAFLGQAQFQLRDDVPPTATSNEPADWTSAPPTTPLTFTGHDDGFGVNYAKIEGPGGWNGATTRDVQCGHGPRCPRDATISTTLGNLPDGDNTIVGTFTDPAPNAVSRPVHAKVDRSGPTVELTDGLKQLEDNQGAPILDGQDRFDGLVHVTDGDPSAGAAGQRSGVQNVTVSLGSAVESTASSASSCTSSCTVDVDDVSVNFDDYATGSTQTLKIEATDRVGNTTTKTVSFAVPAPDDYGSLLSTWRDSVRARVDSARSIPSDPMPAVPLDWRTPEACEASATAVGSCFDRARAWVSDVDAWLRRNRTPTADFSDLPSMPTYGWAPNVTAADLTNAMADGFDAAKQASTTSDLTRSVRVAVTFHAPQSPDAVNAALGGSILTDAVELRGVFEPDQPVALTGGGTISAPSDLTTALNRFYADQAGLAQQEVTEADDELAFPGGDDGTALDPDDLAAVSEHRDRLTRAISTLNAKQPYVTAIVANIRLSSLLVLLHSPLPAVKSVAMSSLQVPDSDYPLLSEVLENGTTDSEIAKWRAIDGSTVTASSPGTASSRAVNTLSGKSCAQANDRGVKKTGIPETFMPNRFSAKVALNGPAHDNGRYNKVSALRMRWVRPGGLAWFCGDSERKRAFEPDTKPEDNGIVNGPYAERRWSGNWTDAGYISTLPKAYKDDLACGNANSCDTSDRFKVSTYPDCSIGSGNARGILYGKLYFSRFETDTGDKDDGVALVRGQQNVKASRKLEQGYCRGRSGAAFHVYLDRYCFFARGTYRYMKIPIRTAHPVHRSANWTQGDRPSGYTDIGTGRGSGGP